MDTFTMQVSYSFKYITVEQTCNHTMCRKLKNMQDLKKKETLTCDHPCLDKQSTKKQIML